MTIVEAEFDLTNQLMNQSETDLRMCLKVYSSVSLA